MGDVVVLSASFRFALILLMLLCLALRIIANIVTPEQLSRNFSMTHLRMDSLLAGVLISYFYYFRFQWLSKSFRRYKYLLLFIAFAGLAWTPFTEMLFNSKFVYTAGFSVLYISFGIILLYFLLEKNINHKLNGVFTAPVASLVSRIGYCSYAIYIIHSFVNFMFIRLTARHNLYNHPYYNFIITTIISVAAGMLITYTVERYFLKLRDRYYPARG